MRVLYSYNKRGYEAAYWQREIGAASTPSCEFIPFNHDPYLDTGLYIRAQLLDNLYFARHAGLMRLYADIERKIAETRADVLLVDTCNPYHPDWLRRLGVYRALRVGDGPLSAYERDFPYLHAFQHVLYHSPAYSPDLGFAEKLRYVGARRFDLWSLGLFDAARDVRQTEESILEGPRPLEIVFVGALHPNKMPVLAAVKKAFGRRCKLFGLASLKRNAYFNARFGWPGWVRPIRAEEYVPLYQKARIGFNVHNRGKFTVGGFRLFELPGNGVMQISDGGEYLDTWFRRGQEIIGYDTVEQLLSALDHHLTRDADRKAVALAGFRRVLSEHTMGHRFRQLESLLRAGMEEERAVAGRTAGSP